MLDARYCEGVGGCFLCVGLPLLGLRTFAFYGAKDHLLNCAIFFSFAQLPWSIVEEDLRVCVL